MLLDTCNDEIRVISMFIISNIIHFFVQILFEILFLCYFQMNLICLITMVIILYNGTYPLQQLAIFLLYFPTFQVLIPLYLL